MSTLSSSGSPVSYLSPEERETSSNTSEDDAIMTEVKRSPAILSARERSLLKAARTKNLRGDHRGTDDDTEPDKLELDDDTDDDLEMCKEEHSYRTYDTDDDLRSMPEWIRSPTSRPTTSPTEGPRCAGCCRACEAGLALLGF